MKMCQLTDEQMSEHYAHHAGKPFFQQLKDAMTVTPVVVCCYEGVDAVEVVRQLAGPTNGRKAAPRIVPGAAFLPLVRQLAGPTNGRKAAPGTIRGDLSMSFQENIVHASDSAEAAEIELKRFFNEGEIFDYEKPGMEFIYASDEL